MTLFDEYIYYRLGPPKSTTIRWLHFLGFYTFPSWPHCECTCWGEIIPTSTVYPWLWLQPQFLTVQSSACESAIMQLNYQLLAMMTF